MPIDLEIYAKSMRYRWGELKKSYNPALEAAWKDMADIFNSHIEGKVKEWSVLQLPTGTGKTQGLAVYCAELAKLPEHPGVLIITRFTEEADKLAALINDLAGTETAIARHNKVSVGDKQVKQSPVLIVTHAAYLLAMKEMDIDVEASERWQRLAMWQGGERRLTVIDETLNTVEQISIGFDELRMLRGFIPYDLESKHPAQTAVLDSVIEKFRKMVREQKGIQKDLPRTYWKDVANMDFKPLADALCKLDLSPMLLGRGSNKAKAGLHGAMRERIQDAFANLTYILSSWSIYAKQGLLHTLSTARVPLPPHIKSAVVLDATASRNYAYALLEKVAEVRPLPRPIKEMRKYEQVRLNVRYGDALGKATLSTKSAEHFLDVLRSVSPKLDKKTPFLFIVHLGVEKKVKTVIEKEYPACKIGHWGAVDGKNDWENIETIILYGLPYLGNVIPECAIRAYKNWYAKAQGQYDPFVEFVEVGDGPNDWYIQHHENLEEAEDYETGHMEVSLIQAVNRIRCRGPIDGEGNCLPATVHLFLREKGQLERSILETFKTLMPGIDIVEDKAALEAKADKLPKAGQKIVDYFSKMPDGDYPTKTEDIPSGTMEKYVRQYKNADSVFGRKMREAGVTDYVGGQGKPGYFVVRRVSGGTKLKCV